MGLLLRAAVLGGIAYFITRSLSGNSMQRRTMGSRNDRSLPVPEPHRGETHVWPTSPSEQSATANAGPTS